MAKKARIARIMSNKVKETAEELTIKIIDFIVETEPDIEESEGVKNET